MNLAEVTVIEIHQYLSALLFLTTESPKKLFVVIVFSLHLLFFLPYLSSENRVENALALVQEQKQSFIFSFIKV